MPSPPIAFKTVRATYTQPNGDPAAGNLRFIPSATVLDSTGNVVIPPTPVTATLDGTGYVEVELGCTDVSGTTPSGWVWQMSELFAGGRETTFSLPSAGGATVDLSDLVPPETVEETFPYATQASVQALDARVTDVEESAGLAVAAVVIHPFVMAN